MILETFKYNKKMESLAVNNVNLFQGLKMFWKIVIINMGNLRCTSWFTYLTKLYLNNLSK